MATDNPSKPISREELFELFKFYDASTKDELAFFFQYFHFYIGLLSAILAVILTGLLNIASKDLRGLTLLIGPVLILILSRVGYNNIQAFYRRFTEAWVTKINIASMLNIQQDSPVEQGIQKPIYASRTGGFIPEIEWHPLKAIFNEAEKNAWPAEQVAQSLVRVGTTLSQARWTFRVFNGAAVVLAIVTILTFVL